MILHKEHRKSTVKSRTTVPKERVAEVTNGTQPPAPDSISAIVTNCENLGNCSNANINLAPFRKGQQVLVLNARRDRQQWVGQIGKVAATVKHSQDTEWTAYVVFLDRRQAVAFVESELGLVLNCLELATPASSEEVAA